MIYKYVLKNLPQKKERGKKTYCTNEIAIMASV